MHTYNSELDYFLDIWTNSKKAIVGSIVSWQEGGFLFKEDNLKYSSYFEHYFSGKADAINKALAIIEEKIENKEKSGHSYLEGIKKTLEILLEETKIISGKYYDPIFYKDIYNNFDKDNEKMRKFVYFKGYTDTITKTINDVQWNIDNYQLIREKHDVYLDESMVVN